MKTIRLFWKLGFVPRSFPKTASGSNDSDVQAQRIAESALAKKVPERIIVEVDEATGPSSLGHAGPIFMFLWDECWITVASLKDLAGLTFVASILFFSWGAATDLREVSYSKITGIGAFSGGCAELLGQSALGVGLSLVLYATSGFLEGRLMKRKAVWNYICAKANIEAGKVK